MKRHCFGSGSDLGFLSLLHHSLHRDSIFKEDRFVVGPKSIGAITVVTIAMFIKLLI